MAESLYKLEQKIATAVMTLKLERDTHVPDLMTRIRILPSIAVVGQKQKRIPQFGKNVLHCLYRWFLLRTPNR